VTRASYREDARRRLAAELKRDGTPVCPECGGALTVTALHPPPGVPYVRRRVLVICTQCRRSATLDVPASAG
jgi:hypothetical protein